MLLGIIVTIALVRIMDQGTFGEYQFVITLIASCGFLALSGGGHAIAQSVARGCDGTFFIVTRAAVFSALLGSLVLAIASKFFYEQMDFELAIAFAMAAVLYPLTQGLTTWTAVFCGRGEFKALSQIEACGNLAIQATILLTIIAAPGNIVAAVAAFTAITALINLLALRPTLRKIRWPLQTEAGSLSYAIKTTIYAAPMLIAKHIEKILLFLVVSPAALALYVTAEKIPELVKSLVNEISAVLTPKLSRHTEYTPKIDRIFKLLSIALGIAIVAIAFLVMPWLHTALFGQAYSESASYSIALMCSVAIGNVGSLRIGFIRSQMDSNSLRTLFLVIGGLRIALAVILIPWIGVQGAVVGAIITRVVGASAVEVIFRKKYAKFA
jgi:O-antigen/teichoic acid export membrane protein